MKSEDQPANLHHHLQVAAVPKDWLELDETQQTAILQICEQKK